MAILHPFKAWHPNPDDVENVACVPYDVISVEEARALAKDNAKSFLHVIRPEIDLPEDTDPHADNVYAKGAENLTQFMNDGILARDEGSSLYVYRLTMDGRNQTGIFACVSVEEYDEEVILKHELTRPEKEDDRTRHILTQKAHAEPVMITYKDDEQSLKLIEQTTQQDPLFSFQASDGVVHQIWKAKKTGAFVEAFKAIPRLYIADGHHRCKSASRAAEHQRSANPDHTGQEEYNFFPAVVFPMSDMRILAYNRVIHSIPENFIRTLTNNFELTEDVAPEPESKGEISIYINNQWYGMKLPVKDQPNSVEKLDVHRLQEFLLAPLLDIKDPRRDTNISFVGGIKGTGHLADLVGKGKAEMAISMYPTSIEELVAVSDEGLLMPPKSTWFEPKLRSGLLVHTF